MSGVRVIESCSVYYRHVVEPLTAGQEIPPGEFADWLAATGAPVEPLDTPDAGESVEDPGTPPAPGGAGTAGDGDLVVTDPAGDGPVSDLELIAQVPDGTKDDVLAWVAGDLERAAAALTAEQARGGKVRTTLVAALSALLDV